MVKIHCNSADNCNSADTEFTRRNRKSYQHFETVIFGTQSIAIVRI